MINNVLNNLESKDLVHLPVFPNSKQPEDKEWQNKKYQKQRYQDDNSVGVNLKLSQILHFDFENAVYLRLQTDRKVALLLSGGIDSSLISSFIKKKDLDNLSFYTIDSNNNKEENLDLHYADVLSKHLGVKLNKISCDLSYKEFNNIMYTLTTQQENPINFFSTAVPTYLISSRMKKDNIHIALDGVGGDEVMGGVS